MQCFSLSGLPHWANVLKAHPCCHKWEWAFKRIFHVTALLKTLRCLPVAWCSRICPHPQLPLCPVSCHSPSSYTLAFFQQLKLVKLTPEPPGLQFPQSSCFTPAFHMAGLLSFSVSLFKCLFTEKLLWLSSPHLELFYGAAPYLLAPYCLSRLVITFSFSLFACLSSQQDCKQCKNRDHVCFTQGYIPTTVSGL